MSKKNYITGIGGLFIKSDDPKKMNQWYSETLNLNTTEYGTTFRFIDERSGKKAVAQFSFFSKDSDYFDPSKREAMFNFRVQNIEEFLEKLKSNGVEVVGEIQSFDYGKFAHIIDPEGNKIELWEPIDSGFGPMIEDDSQVNF